jgi:hypothetical protein
VDRDTGAAADLDEEVPQAGRVAFAVLVRGPCGRVLPAGDHVDLGLGELHDLGQLIHFGAGQAAADDHAGAFDEAFGFHPVFLCRQSEQVGHGVGHHHLPDAALPVEAGQRVDPVDDPAPGPQRPPEFVEDDEVVAAGFEAGVGQHLGDVDGGEPVRPARQQCRGLEVELAVVDPGQVERDRAVAAHRLGGVAGEDRPELRGAFGEAGQGRLQAFGEVTVAGDVAAVEGGGTNVFGRVLHDLEQVREDRYAVVAAVEDLHRPADHGLLSCRSVGCRRAEW